MKPTTDHRACTLLTVACFALTLVNGWTFAQVHLERQRAADDRYRAEKLVESADKLNAAAIASNRAWTARFEFAR